MRLFDTFRNEYCQVKTVNDFAFSLQLKKKKKEVHSHVLSLRLHYRLHNMDSFFRTTVLHVHCTLYRHFDIENKVDLYLVLVTDIKYY